MFALLLIQLSCGPASFIQSFDHGYTNLSLGIGQDLSTWLALFLQHDGKVHNSDCELSRVSVLSG